VLKTTWSSGYVQKERSVDELLGAIRGVLKGQTCVIPEIRDRVAREGQQAAEKPVAIDKLSDRELQVFELLGQGRSSREIAEHLHLSIKTIETHREHIKKKLLLRNSSELVRNAVEWVIQTRE